jgi:hypothetical protein
VARIAEYVYQDQHKQGDRDDNSIDSCRTLRGHALDKWLRDVTGISGHVVNLPSVEFFATETVPQLFPILRSNGPHHNRPPPAY